jgi:hypothetical protein
MGVEALPDDVSDEGAERRIHYLQEPHPPPVRRSARSPGLRGASRQVQFHPRDCHTPPPPPYPREEGSQVGGCAELAAQSSSRLRLVLRIWRLRRRTRTRPQGRRARIRSRCHRGIEATRWSSWKRLLHRWHQALLPQERLYLRACAGGAALRCRDQAAVPALPRWRAERVLRHGAGAPHHQTTESVLSGRLRATLPR